MMLSAELKKLVGQYAVATIRDEQLALLDSVISAWSKTADFKTFDEKVTSITVNGRQRGFLMQSYQHIRDSLYDELLLSTCLKNKNSFIPDLDQSFKRICLSF